MDTSSVDLPLFLSRLPTATPPMMERSYFLPGPKKISELEERDGGTKLQERSVLVDLSATGGLTRPQKIHRCKLLF